MGDSQNNMSSKQESSKKVLDISRPKKRPTATGAPSAPLIIPKRSVIVPVSGSEEPVSEPSKAKQTAEDIQPPVSDPVPTEQAPSLPKQAEAPAEPETESDETAPSEEVEEVADSPEPEDADTNPKSAKGDHHVRKALEDAKREQELQGYIENRDFFVPINAVARKRSLKVSLMLLFVELLLGLLLVNLMLDAGLINLLEKIPHTNFFDL
jgi:hypothetical protein